MTDKEPLVRVQNLHKSYGHRNAVNGLTFSLARGEIFGLLGPNGAGKTTTMNLIAGLLTPTQGEVQIAGEDSKRRALSRKRALGVVPQELAIYPRLTGRENLHFFGQLYGLRGTALRERANEMLHLVGLSERAYSRAETYSGGMKRRLNLAVGLMHRPQLLLLDEPTTGVDPQSRNHIFEGIRALNRQGLTLLYTSHYMEEVENLCHRVGIMDNGTLIACDTVPNLIARLGGARIEIEIEGVTDVSKLLALLRDLESVLAVEFSPASATQGTLHIRARQAKLTLPGLIALLNQAPVKLLSLHITQPNLEDVFLHLTGKSLRD